MDSTSSRENRRAWRTAVQAIGAEASATQSPTLNAAASSRRTPRHTRRTTAIVAAVAVCALGLVAACLFLVLPRMHGDVSHVNRRVVNIGDRSEQDVEAAMDAVEERFASGFRDCALTDLWFDAERRNPEYEEEYGADNVLVLDSKFTTGPWADPSLNPDSGYTWEWVLVRTDAGWSIKSYGSG